jgi:hypothetical protein
MRRYSITLLILARLVDWTDSVRSVGTAAEIVPMKTRVLVASVQQAHRRLIAILGGHDLTFVSTLTEAEAALRADGFNLIMVGTHFDESKVFDLLRSVKADAKYSRVPVICFRGIKFAETYDKSLVQIVEMACKEMGAAHFFDLVAFPDDARGNAHVRSVINRVLDRTAEN